MDFNGDAELLVREHGDDERAARATVERDLLTGELARVVGLGGRDRRALPRSGPASA